MRGRQQFGPNKLESDYEPEPGELYWQAIGSKERRPATTEPAKLWTASAGGWSFIKNGQILPSRLMMAKEEPCSTPTSEQDLDELLMNPDHDGSRPGGARSEPLTSPPLPGSTPGETRSRSTSKKRGRPRSK